MRPVLLVPGIGNSGPTHWQSLWEARHPDVTRVAQADWDHPVCDTWCDVLEQAVRRTEEPPVVVAHSLGCLVVARWAAQSSRSIHSMLLVAVPDPAGPSFPQEAIGFAALPVALPGRRVVVVSSRDDPYATPAFARQRALAWGAEHLDLGAKGHINASSGLADWPQGWAIVERWR